MQLAQIAADGNAAEKALLADVTAKNPDAAYTELLRLFKVRRRLSSSLYLVYVASCLLQVAAHICSEQPHGTSVSTQSTPV